MRLDDRGTGRTGEMLDRVQADRAKRVVVVAHTSEYAAELALRYYRRRGSDAALWRTPPARVHREDGRTIDFVGPDPLKLEGMGCPVYVDHAVFDLVHPDRWEALADAVQRCRDRA